MVIAIKYVPQKYELKQNTIVINNNLFRLDLFGKAKEKILKNDIVKKEERRYVWDPQEIGLYFAKLLFIRTSHKSMHQTLHLFYIYTMLLKHLETKLFLIQSSLVSSKQAI